MASTLPNFIEDEYPDNRLAILVDRENRLATALLFLSARYGVFRLSRGAWLKLSDSDRRQFKNFHYFHADMSRYNYLMDIFSYEDPGGVVVPVPFDDVIAEEIVYEFEEPFWGPGTKDDEPYQLRDFSEIVEFADGYPSLSTVFNKSDDFKRASDWSAHGERDLAAVSWIQSYQEHIREIRRSYKSSPVIEQLYWVDQLPALNIFAQQVLDLTNSLYEEDPSVSQLPGWAESDAESEFHYLERELLQDYLKGTQALTVDEVLEQCSFLIGRFRDGVSVVDETETQIKQAPTESVTFERLTRSSTPFGPGSLAFVIAPGDLVLELVLETDLGLFYLSKSEPEAPDFPIWLLWDFGKYNQNLSGHSFVYVARNNFNAALELYQKTRDHDLIILRKEHVLPFWSDETEDNDDELREGWKQDIQFYSRTPFEVRYLVDWAIEYVNRFGKKYVNGSEVSEAENLFRFRNGELALSRSDLQELITVNTVWQF